MSLTTIIFSLLELLIGASAAIVASVAWKYRDKPAGLPLFAMAVTTILYALTSATKSFVTRPPIWDILTSLSFPLTVAIAVGSFYLTVEFTQREEYKRPGISGILLGIVLLSFGVAITNPFHQLMVAGQMTTAEGELFPIYGPLFWANTLLSLAIILWSITLLAVELVAAKGVYRKQISAVIVAFLIGIGFFLWETLAPIHPAFNLATVGIAGWCAVTLWGVFRIDFLKTAPMARRALIDNMDAAVFAFDTNNRLVEINPSASEQFDIDVDEVGAPATEVLDTYPILLELITNDQSEQEVTLQPGSEERHFNVRTSPVSVTSPRANEVGHEAQSVGQIVVVRDVTERKQRETEIRRNRELLRHTEQLADTGGWELDATSGTQRWTNGTYMIHDLAPHGDFEPTIDASADFYHPDDQEIIRRAVDECLETGEAFDEELRLITAEDRLRWVRVAGEASTATDAEADMRGAIQDITAHKEREQELERQNERLDEFVSVVSHDLRNPLNVAMGRVDLAQQECESDHLDAVAQAHERMATLLEDLLTLARSGQTIDEVEAVNLAACVEVCWQNVDTAGATLVTNTSLQIMADCSRLRQLLENLLRNAVEHGGREVTVEIGELDDGFYLADDGPGIPKAKQSQVFDSEYSTSDDGTGFGLHIVEQIVHAHGWSITITESANSGARFEINGVDICND